MYAHYFNKKLYLGWECTRAKCVCQLNEWCERYYNSNLLASPNKKKKNLWIIPTVCHTQHICLIVAKKKTNHHTYLHSSQVSLYRQALTVFHSHSIGHTLLVGVPNGKLLDVCQLATSKGSLEASVVLSCLVDNQFGFAKPLRFHHSGKGPLQAGITELFGLVIHIDHRLRQRRRKKRWELQLMVLLISWWSKSTSIACCMTFASLGSNFSSENLPLCWTLNEENLENTSTRH